MREGRLQPSLQSAGVVRAMRKSHCIYCHAPKTPDEFNREHVLPVAFGTYAGNLVLHGRVCALCNDYFSKQLDAPLARDSKEGIERFQQGLVREKKRRRFGRRVALRQRGGLFDGSLLELDLDSTGTELAPRPSRQLGFGSSEEGPFDWYRVDDLPDVETLRAKGFCYVVTGGLSAEEAAELFQKLGLAMADERAVLPDPRDASGMLDTTMQGRIDTTIYRAVAKIAFNYLAYVYPSLASMDQLREAREFIRFDVPMDPTPVAISATPILGDTPAGTRILAHVLTVAWSRTRHRIVAQVSLFGWLRYEVSLTRERFIFPPTFVASGHAFNPFAGQIAALTRDRLKAVVMPLLRREELPSRPLPNGKSPAR